LSGSPIQRPSSTAVAQAAAKSSPAEAYRIARAEAERTRALLHSARA
jgi:hypothetical protein